MAEPKTPEQMDAAADLAEAEIMAISKEQPCSDCGAVGSLVEVADWWKRWYLEAGHKRLGRVLLKFQSK